MSELSPRAQLEVGSLLNRSWQLVNWKFWRFLSIAALTFIVPSAVVFLAAVIAANLICQSTGNFFMVGDCMIEVRHAFLAFVSLATPIAVLVLWPGWLFVCLKVANQDNFSLRDVLQPMNTIISVFIAAILVGLTCALGYCLLIIPGIFLGIKLLLTPYFVVDKRLGPVAAMGESWQATSGIWWLLFGFNLSFGLLIVITNGFLTLIVNFFFDLFHNLVGNLFFILSLPVLMAWSAGLALIYRLRTAEHRL
jgi:hypothetical protein